MTIELEALKLISDKQLRDQCIQHIQQCPSSKPVIEAILSHFASTDTAATCTQQNQSTKKRKLETDNDELVCSVSDVSFSTPRKKSSLNFFADHLAVPGEIQMPYNEIYACMLLPTLGKQRPTTTLVVFAKSCNIMASFVSNDLLSSTGIQDESIATSEDLFRYLFRNIAKVEVLSPSSKDFKSNFPNTHGLGSARNKEQLCCECHLKAKDGYIYFLTEAIFFGFKKPYFMLKHERIVSFSIESLTTRTFNLKINYKAEDNDLVFQVQQKANSDGNVSIDFAMIDNCDFDPIVAYLTKYKLGKVSVGGVEMGEERASDPSENNNALFGDDYNEDEDEDFQCKSGQGSETETETDDHPSDDSTNTDSESAEDEGNGEQTLSFDDEE